MIKISVDEGAVVSTRKWLSSLAMSDKQKAKVIRKAAQLSIRKSRRNRFRQQTPEGKRWAKRKSTKSKKYMQEQLGKFVTVTKADYRGATIGWRNGRTASIAGIHHAGHKIKSTRAQAIKQAKSMKQPDPQDGCGRRLAKKLRQLGYKTWARRRNPNAPVGKLWRPPTSWIQKNLSPKQAGYIYSLLRGKPKESWTVNMPLRPFLELDEKAMQMLITQEIYGLPLGHYQEAMVRKNKIAARK